MRLARPARSPAHCRWQRLWRRWRSRLLTACCASVLAAPPSLARDGAMEVDAELVLAVDISYSMDRNEQVLQREGYIRALTSPEFLTALKANAIGKIGVAYMQWASYTDQDVLVGWSVIDGPQSASDFASKLHEAPYRRAQRTSISGAIDAGVKLLEQNGFKSSRLILDISGDGPNNNGRFVTQAREEALAKGITINGLPLVGIREYIGPADIKDLDIYYEDCVIGGPEAFSVSVHDTKSFVDATRSKLIREIAAAPAGRGLHGDAAGRPKLRLVQEHEPRISCTIGESMSRGRRGN